MSLQQVLGKLLPFLSLEEMKALTEVSKSVRNTVRQSEQFFDRARFNISQQVWEEGLPPGYFHFWKHISVELISFLGNCGIPFAIGEVLERVESIYLYLPHPPSPIDDNDPPISDKLEEILRNTVNLRTLGLEARIVSKVRPEVDIQDVLSSLHSIDIHQHRSWVDGPIYCREEAIQVKPFEETFLSSAELNLKSIRFGRDMDTSSVLAFLDDMFIVKLIEESKDTLEELEFHLGYIDMVNFWYDMEGIRCRYLERCTVSTLGFPGNMDIFTSFLRYQPPLKELDISLDSSFYLRSLQGLGRKRKLGNLERFRVRAICLVPFAYPMEWEFLQGFTQLKEISLHETGSWKDGFRTCDRDWFCYGGELLKELPPSLEKISMRGFQMWKKTYSSERYTGKVISRFPNLTELNLLESRGAVTDLGLQSLIANCQNLTSLSFSHCPQLTDYGLSGVPPGEGEENGHSLDELKGLHHLAIRSCQNISTEGLLFALKFKSLRYCDLHLSPWVPAYPKPFILQIVKQNPSLERLQLYFGGSSEDGQEYFNDLRGQLKDMGSCVKILETLEQPEGDGDTDSELYPDADDDGDDDGDNEDVEEDNGSLGA